MEANWSPQRIRTASVVLSGSMGRREVVVLSSIEGSGLGDAKLKQKKKSYPQRHTKDDEGTRSGTALPHRQAVARKPGPRPRVGFL